MPAKKAHVADKKPASRAAVAESGTRVRKLKKKEQKKLTTPLPNAWTLLKDALRHLYRNKKLFLGILAIYGILYILLVKGVSESFQLTTSRDSFDEILGDSQSALQTGVSLYGVLLGTAGSSSTDLAGLYQTMLFVIVSLAVIWSLRQTYAAKAAVTIRSAFYESTGQLVPFIIVLFFVALHCVPVIIGVSVYSTIVANTLVMSGPEQLLSLSLLAGGLAWSLYLLSSSLFALYIVTLPGKRPRAALKAARELVKLRRMQLARKIFFLPVLFMSMSAAVLIPLLIVFTPAAELLFLLFTILVLGITHSYLYALYRNLLDEGTA